MDNLQLGSTLLAFAALNQPVWHCLPQTSQFDIRDSWRKYAQFFTMSVSVLKPRTTYLMRIQIPQTGALVFDILAQKKLVDHDSLIETLKKNYIIVPKHF